MHKFLYGLVFLALIFPSPVKAVTVDQWQELGSPYEKWEVEATGVTGYSEHPNSLSFLISEPAIQVAPNFKFSFSLTPLQGLDHNVVWNFVDEDNYYQIHFNLSSVVLTRFINGQVRVNKGRQYSLNLGETYDLTIEQAGAQISVEINNQPVIGLNDRTHDNNSQGRVGFKLAPGATYPVETSFSSIQLVNTSLTALPVERIVQTHTSWRYAEYDTASLWSDEPSIERWGCALTSLVMVMRYHDLKLMPDGKEVNPREVNLWLKAQPDGYVGEGLLNWWAGTRLIKEISDQYSTAEAVLPKLEFSYQQADWLTGARNSILAGNPLIAQVPGHFVVVSGFDEQSDDFFIQDPFYDFTRLNQHDETLSIRLLTPSQTDLSAMVVVHNPADEVEILNSEGEVVSQSWQEQLQAPLINITNTNQGLTVVSQPSAGKYNIKGKGDLQLITYDQQANPTIHFLENITEEQNIVLDFKKNTKSSLETTVFSWDDWLIELAKIKELIGAASYSRIEILAGYAQQAEKNSWIRYKNYIYNILEIEKSGGNAKEIEAVQRLLK